MIFRVEATPSAEREAQVILAWLLDQVPDLPSREGHSEMLGAPTPILYSRTRSGPFLGARAPAHSRRANAALPGYYSQFPSRS